jgi:hypothetical protein
MCVFLNGFGVVHPPLPVSIIREQAVRHQAVAMHVCSNAEPAILRKFFLECSSGVTCTTHIWASARLLRF